MADFFNAAKEESDNTNNKHNKLPKDKWNKFDPNKPRHSDSKDLYKVCEIAVTPEARKEWCKKTYEVSKTAKASCEVNFIFFLYCIF